MNNETCWTLIQAVNNGDEAARDDFVSRYLPPVRAYLRARWRGGPLSSEADDAVQEVFMRCFGTAGPLERVERISTQGFRGYLYGICRNVAREHEQALGRKPEPHGDAVEDLPDRENRLSATFDRAFAQQVMKEARDTFRSRASSGDKAAQRRFELLALRFEENLPIREIADRWKQPAAQVHKEYARARREYREALLAVVAEQNPDRTPTEIEEAAKHLLDLIS